MTTWDELFERAASFGATEDLISDALRARREGDADGADATRTDEGDTGADGNERADGGADRV